MTCPLSHACFAMFGPFSGCSFLMCSAFLVFRDLSVSTLCNSKRRLYTVFYKRHCFFSSVGGLCFTVENSCCAATTPVLKGSIISADFYIMFA